MKELPLDACELGKRGKRGESQLFEQSIDRVMATTSDQDDYAENLYGGMRQAIRDLAAADNTKLLFVLRLAVTRRRNRRRLTRLKLSQRLKRRDLKI